MNEHAQPPRRNDLVIALATAGVLGAIALAAWIQDFPIPENSPSWRPAQKPSQISPVSVRSTGLASQTEPAVMTRQRNPREFATKEQDIRAWLKQLHHAQTAWQAARMIDSNRNGLGEFALLAELRGERTDRCRDGATVPPFKGEPTAIRSSILNVHGYLVQIFLPDAEDQAVSEGSNGGLGVVHPDPDRSERFWCCYAWPEQGSKTGKSAYFIDQRGKVLRSANAVHEYSGRFRRPLPSAAFAISTKGLLGSALATEELGSDGQRWTFID